jgi:hypothetical protein
MMKERFENFLCSKYPFHIRMRLGKKSQQPCPATRSPCKIQFMKNGKFLFRVKDRNIAECGFIDVHETPFSALGGEF